jgi:hypothetical protein
MPAYRHGHPWTVEDPGFAARVVEEAVVARVQAARDRERHLDVDRDPVPKEQPVAVELVPQFDVPAGQVVDPEGAAGSQQANALGDPPATPLQVVAVGHLVADPRAIFLGQVERRVGEDELVGARRELREDLQAVALEERAEVGGVAGLQDRDRTPETRRHPAPAGLTAPAFHSRLRQ